VGRILRRFDVFLDWVHRVYDTLLRAALAHRIVTIIIALASLGIAVPLANVVGTEMMPQADESFTSLKLTMPVGSSLDYADDLEMQRVIGEFKQKIAAIKGVTDIDVSLKEGTPALSVRLKPELASEIGITNAQLGATLRAFIGGEISGYWLAPDGQNYEVMTQLPRANRTAVEDVANLNISTG